jgi:tripeptide aminopeptidase
MPGNRSCFHDRLEAYPTLHSIGGTPMNAERLLQRFLRYVAIDTQADDTAQGYPSSPGQWELGRLIVAELQELRLADVEQDEHGLVWATVPATDTAAGPTIAFNAHLDTSPESSGANVKPQVLRAYAGGDIRLAGDPQRVIRMADNPELEQLRGCTLVTTDGTTLLGADDKAGLAVIVEVAAHLTQHPDIVHGPVRILFTCDEEIGHGTDHVDLDKLAATACYTLDGRGAGEIDVETFSADLATVRVQGVNIHPSIAQGRMVNAVRAAAALIARLPRDTLSPESTAGRDGFLHPYQVRGGVGEVVLKVLLRDFDTEQLTHQAQLLRGWAQEVETEVPGCHIVVEVARQYRNMAEGLVREPRAVSYARQAFERLGHTPRLTIVRGGTDGSQLTARGLPTPNLSTGQHNPHSPLEWACLDEMLQAVRVLIELVQVWAEGPA